MSKRQIIMVLGFLVIVIPFFGFGYNINTAISIIVGITIIIIAYNSRPSLVDDSEKAKNYDSKDTKKDLPFVESINDNNSSKP